MKKFPAPETHTSHVVEKPILIVDPIGHIGVGLYEELKEKTSVVLASGKEPSFAKNLVFLHYKKRIPQIPDTVYSTIFFVWQGEKETFELLPEFLEKAKRDNSKFIFIFSYKYFHDSIIQQLFEVYKGVKFLVVGDMFGGNLLQEKLSVIDDILYEAKSHGTMHLTGVGIEKLFPVLFADTISQILQCTYGLHESAVFFIVPKYPLTQLGLAHILQKIDPLLRIDFLEKKEFTESFFESYPHAIHVFKDAYPTEERIKEVYMVLSIPKEPILQISRLATRSQSLQLRGRKIKRLRFPPLQKKSIGVFLLSCFVFFIALPVLFIPLFVLLATRNLYTARDVLEKGNLSQAKQSVVQAGTQLKLATDLGNFFSTEIGYIGLRSLLDHILQNIQTEKFITEHLQDVLDGGMLLQSVEDGKSTHPQKDFSQGLHLIASSAVAFQSASIQKSLPQNYSDKVKSLATAIEYFVNTQEAYPSLLGMGKPKTYLVVFQNNMELRPGGGFVGSYGIAKFDKGRLTDFSIHDVYDADGQLKEHIEPPFAIRRYIPIVHLYLRDSNFDIDFPKGAALAAIMLREETGTTVDGVIGIDLSFVKDIIAGLGSVYVPDYNETVTADNFFLLTEKHAEKNTFAGSTQKKDFLRSLFIGIQAKLAAGKHTSYLSLIGKGALAVQEKHVLFAFADPVFQNLFTVNGMSSSLWDPRISSSDTINDFIGINEANIGVNKVNYFIQRGISQKTTIGDDGTVTEEIHLSYTNTSKKDEWPGGDYKNYLRFITPSGSKLTGITIDGQNQNTVLALTNPQEYEKKGFIPPSGLEVETYEQSGKAVYGFLVGIPAQSSKTISITYTLSQKINVGQPVLHYSEKIFKQPGTDNDPFSYSLNFPKSYGVLRNSSGTFVNGTTVSSLTNLATDKNINVDFTKN